MSNQLHILNSTGKFNGLINLIESQFEASISKISKLLEIPNIDVVVDYSTQVIPETGFSGFSPSANTVYLYLDPANENLLDNFEQEFLATLGHEIHHCIRHGGPGYGLTLADALITEGLACHFETELRNGTVPFYAKALDLNQLQSILKKLESQFESKTYDHQSLFYGSTERSIPKYTGYSIGYHLVNQSISLDKVPASQLALTPTSHYLNR